MTIVEQLAPAHRRRMAKCLRELARRVEAGELLMIDGTGECGVRQLASEGDWENWQPTEVLDWNFRFLDLDRAIRSARMKPPQEVSCG